MDEGEENRLESLLRLAIGEPAHRPEFYRVLLDTEVFILGHTGNEDGAEAGMQSLAAGDRIAIQNWQRQDGSPIIPFFSSLAMLQAAIEDEQPYLVLPVKALFEMTRGATLVLNPISEFPKEFVSDEIAQLLENGPGTQPETRVVEEETHVLLGQPGEYPAKMVDSLIQFFAKHAEVNAAWLALMHDTSVDDKPHLVVGIETDGEIEPVIREAGAVVMDTAPEGEPVDMYHVREGDSGLSEYFLKEVKPFYERSWGRRLGLAPEPGQA
ncbi:MAG TPA: enhanced serine sensitivity protein SseB [Gammaproteobacteria bacterium]|nr:enhanced serine sensitivity protein SseB [Gammaproteobacteria bacterium]